MSRVRSYFKSSEVSYTPDSGKSRVKLSSNDDVSNHQVSFKNESKKHNLVLQWEKEEWTIPPCESLDMIYEDRSWFESRIKCGVQKHILLTEVVNQKDVPIPCGAKTMLAVLVASGSGGEGAYSNPSGTVTSRPGMGGGSGDLVTIVVDLKKAVKLQVTVGEGGAGGKGSTVLEETRGGHGIHTSIFLYDKHGELIKQICSMGGKETNQDAGLIYTGGGAYGGGGPTGSKYELGSFGSMRNGFPASVRKAGDGGGLPKLNPIGGDQYGGGIGGVNVTTQSTTILGGGGGGIGPGDLIGSGGDGGSFECPLLVGSGPAKGQPGSLGSGGGGGSYFSSNTLTGPYIPQDGGKGGNGYAGLTFLF